MRFDGASIFVTGGSRGIGKAIALRFAELGATRVAIGYLRNDRAAEAAAEELRGVGAEPVLVRGNVSSERVAREVAGLGPLTALIHNAATGVIRPALEVEKKHWDWTLDANSYALLALAKVAAPQMQPGSSIVGLSSLGSTRVLENYVAVGTSKAALESLVRYLAVELAPRGIRVNAVSAGVVETEALEHFPNRDEMVRIGRERTPAGRLVEPADVADAVTWLCSPEAEMVCGHTLVVDGGFSLLAQLGRGADRLQPAGLGRDPPPPRRGDGGSTGDPARDSGAATGARGQARAPPAVRDRRVDGGAGRARRARHRRRRFRGGDRGGA